MEMIKKLENYTFIDPKGYNHLIVNLSSYNEKIYKDAVTGALNRLYYEEKIKMETEPAGIAIIDIDNFKACNDTYGHKAGDEVLKTVVNVISQNIREDDAVIRFGGDEFLIVLQGIKQKSFNPKLEHIRSMICSTVIPGFEKLRISISVGAVITDGESIESSVIKADQLMYRAKKKKNSVVTEWDLKPIELVDEEIEKPVIILNENTPSEIIARSYELGASEYIEKPYNKEIIKTRISNIIRLYGKESISKIGN